MNGIQFAVCICIILAAFHYIPRAFRLDRADYHLAHGPLSGCIECEGK